MDNFHILRTKVKEDNLGPFNELDPNSELFIQTNSKLKHVQVVDRFYMFFVQSASQLRMSSCFLINKHSGYDLREMWNH